MFFFLFARQLPAFLLFANFEHKFLLAKMGFFYHGKQNEARDGYILTNHSSLSRNQLYYLGINLYKSNQA